MALLKMVHCRYCDDCLIYWFVSLLSSMFLCHLPFGQSLTYLESFLYGFLVPILPYMFRNRLNLDISQTQRLTSAVLSLHGFISAVSGPVIGHFADKTLDRKTPLLLSLAGCIAGTIMVACSRVLPFLFLGRILQGVAGSTAWIVGLATVADTLGQDNMGTVMGVIMSFVNAGMISGPMVSGIMLEVAGYWLTWCVPLLVLVVDVIARLLMIEAPEESSSDSSSEVAEATSLLPQQERSNSHDASTTIGFWRFMLSDIRVVTTLIVAISCTGMNTSFHTTLALHTQEAFGWGTSRVGFMFFLLAMPAIILGPFAGMLRDRIGVKIPATISLILQAMMMGLLGAAGNPNLPWASFQNRGPALFIAGIIAMGTLRPFVSGIGPVELTGECRYFQMNPAKAMTDAVSQPSLRHMKNRSLVSSGLEVATPAFFP
jgi:MFS family permease